MQPLIDFLSSPLWQGIQGIIAIVGLIISLTKPRKWLLDRPNTKWLVQVPWAWFLIVGGITMGLSMGIKYQDRYFGLFVASAVTAISMGILWLQNSLLLSRFRETYSQLATSYSNLLKAIDRLHSPEFTLSEWTVSHTVYENGTGVLKEEVTIVPLTESIIYYYVRYSIQGNSGPSQIKISAVNTFDNTPLDCYEVSKNEHTVTYMIILDPPSTISAPRRISITCERSGIWEELVKHGHSEGSINATYKANSIKLELIAPPNLKWKALHPVPQIGNVQIDSLGSHSRAIWEIANPSTRKYNYRVFVDSLESKDLA